MRVYVLEQKLDKLLHWTGYDQLDKRIAVVAANETEARRIAAESQSLQSREKGHGRADLDEAIMKPWNNHDASTCRVIEDTDGARVLAIQRHDVDAPTQRIMA